MINQNVFYFIQITISILLVLLVLLQSKGTGLGATFGSGMGFYRSRRGVEKMLMNTTIVLAALFIITSIIRLLL